MWCKAWLDEVVRLTGLPRKRVLVYTGMWWWKPPTGASLRCSGHPLWLSGYSKQPPVISGWRTFRFWQYTNQRQVPGIGPCDASYFNGYRRGLRKLAGLK